MVGIVGGTKHFQLSEPQLLQAYIPHAQRPQIFTTVAVRGTAIRCRWPAPFAQRSGASTKISRCGVSLDGSPARRRDRLAASVVRLTAGFAIVALLLGAIGIYGVLS